MGEWGSEKLDKYWFERRSEEDLWECIHSGNRLLSWKWGAAPGFELTKYGRVAYHFFAENLCDLDWRCLAVQRAEILWVWIQRISMWICRAKSTCYWIARVVLIWACRISEFCGGFVHHRFVKGNHCIPSWHEISYKIWHLPPEHTLCCVTITTNSCWSRKQQVFLV